MSGALMRRKRKTGAAGGGDGGGGTVGGPPPKVYTSSGGKEHYVDPDDDRSTPEGRARYSAARRASAVPSKDGPGRAVERKSQNEKLQKIEQQKELEAEERRISNQKAAAAAAGLTHEELAC